MYLSVKGQPWFQGTLFTCYWYFLMDDFLSASNGCLTAVWLPLIFSVWASTISALREEAPWNWGWWKKSVFGKFTNVISQCMMLYMVATYLIFMSKLSITHAYIVRIKVRYIGSIWLHKPNYSWFDKTQSRYKAFNEDTVL